MARDIPVLLFLLVLQSAARSQEFFNTTPQPIKSNFTCVGRQTGYYADVPSNCRVYHNCDDQGNKFSYYCPEMTAFRQEALICDHAHLVDCQAGTRIGKKKAGTPGTLDQSTSATTRTAGRWTTANPFHDFLLNARKTRPVDVASKIPGSDTFGFGFSNASNSGKKEIFGDAKPRYNNRGENLRDRPEVAVEAKLGDGHVERRAESATSYFPFGQTQTTKSYFNFKNSNYPWSDKAGTRSTQIPGSTSPRTPGTTPPTSDIPLRDFTASLKPLVPNTLEYDPYYPGGSWTTESYYTPSERNELPRALEAPNFQPSIFGVYFKVPDVWPDLNTLDDIVDRRKLFYIPKTDKL